MAGYVRLATPGLGPTEIRDAERSFVNDILQKGLESGNNKPLWIYEQSPKQESCGISVLKVTAT